MHRANHPLLIRHLLTHPHLRRLRIPHNHPPILRPRHQHPHLLIQRRLNRKLLILMPSELQSILALLDDDVVVQAGGNDANFRRGEEVGVPELVVLVLGGARFYGLAAEACPGVPEAGDPVAGGGHELVVSEGDVDAEGVLLDLVDRGLGAEVPEDGCVVGVGGEEVVGAGVEFEGSDEADGGGADEGADEGGLDAEVVNLDHGVVGAGGDVGEVGGPVEVVDGEEVVFHHGPFFLLFVVVDEEGAVPVAGGHDGGVGSELADGGKGVAFCEVAGDIF